MAELLKLRVTPEIGYNEEALKAYLHEKLQWKNTAPLLFSVKRRSVDARQKQIWVQLDVALFDSINEIPPKSQPQYRQVHRAPEVHIVGAGPAGLFAALKLIELGLKPVVFERGKNVRERRFDLASINKQHIVNPESNYCYGEGGAGTYSDGKLYTRSHKRGSIDSVLNTFFFHGASPEILIETHPHIGTNKLPGIIEAMRHTIVEHGGEIHFSKKLTDLHIVGNTLEGISLNGNERVKTQHLLLATGHSARDIYTLLHQKHVPLEFKPFAMGVRIEHPQAIVDKMQYHCSTRGPYLPAASYSWVEQVYDRSVYSFCMCPGGIIAPCATQPGEVVTNGWSPSKRNNPYANSGIVTEIKADDLKGFEPYGPLAGMYFQQSVEQICCQAAGGTQAVPAQRLVDFVQGKITQGAMQSSYKPGLASLPIHELLPGFMAQALQKAFAQYSKKRPAYFTNDAILHAVESRTSTPVRIPRDAHSGAHITVKGLFPCGEGAGYAGGIVSAAMDGQKAALWAKQAVECQNK